MPAAPRAVAFDFNGTLSQDEPIMYAIYREMFGRLGRPISEDEYFGALAGNSEEAIIGGWLGAEGDELAALVDERVERYRELTADGSTISAEARAAVRYAAERVPVAIVSGAFRREIEPVLVSAGLRPALALIVSADDVANGKPHPEAYEQVARRLDLEPRDVLAFEDTEVGVAAAKAAGLRCVALRGTVAPERLAAADELAERLDVELLRRLLG